MFTMPLKTLLILFVLMSNHLEKAMNFTHSGRYFKKMAINAGMQASITKTLVINSTSACAAICKSNEYCIGFNFYLKQDKNTSCEIVTGNSTSTGKSLTVRNGVDYYEEICNAKMLKDYCYNGGSATVVSNSHCSKLNCSCPVMFRGVRCEKSCDYVLLQESDIAFFADMDKDGRPCYKSNLQSMLNNCALDLICQGLVYDAEGSLCWFKSANALTNPEKVKPASQHIIYSLRCT